MIDESDDGFERLAVPAGGVIFLQGQSADKAYLILKGHVDILIAGPSDEKIVIARVGPGELFGEIALLRQDLNRTASTVAADNCELLKFDRDVFESRMRKADPFLRFILEHMTCRLVNTTARLSVG